MNKPIYRTIIVTDFELRMLESLPKYRMNTNSPQWKAYHILKRILKRNKLEEGADEPAVTCYVTEVFGVLLALVTRGLISFSQINNESE